jgi:hypothetical protein
MSLRVVGANHEWVASAVRLEGPVARGGQSPAASLLHYQLAKWCRPCLHAVSPGKFIFGVGRCWAARLRETFAVDFIVVFMCCTALSPIVGFALSLGSEQY